MAVIFAKLMTEFAYILIKIDKIGWGSEPKPRKIKFISDEKQNA